MSYIFIVKYIRLYIVNSYISIAAVYILCVYVYYSCMRALPQC